MNPLDFLLRNPSGRDAGNIARQRLNARAAVPKSGGGVPRATAGFLANPIFAAYAIPGYSEQKSRNAAGVIEGTRGPLNELQYIGGELLRGRMPYSKPLNAIQTGKYGSTDWNPSANPLRVPSADVVADRSYKEDLSRAKQLAEQDQLAKKYQVAELTKAYNTASPEEKSKIGLQIWATTNPELAQRLKPGQTGYSEAVTAFQSQSPLGAIAKAAGDVQYADLGNKAFTSPTGPGGVPLGFSPGQLQTPLTGIEIPSTDKIGVSEFFSNTTPAPGAMEAFTDPLSMLSPERLDNAKRALLIQAYNKKLK
jgi:hypothetical protein